MIFKINKDYTHKTIGSLIQYHEDKVAEGLATKDYCLATISMENRETIEYNLRQHMTLYCPRKRTKHFHQISCNFNVNDKKLTETDKQSIIGEYVEAMGYDKTLHAAYRHSDKEHDHWHIVATAADIEGRVIECRDDFHKSARITRQLEKKYGLEVLNEQGAKSISEKQLKHDEYRYARALSAYFSSIDSKDIHPSFDLAKEGNGIKLTNRELHNLYTKHNLLEEFRIMIRLMSKAKLVPTSKASEIKSRVEIFKNECSDIYSFMRSFNERKGYYARYVKADNEIHYGYDGVYFKADKLGKEFTARGLKSFWHREKGVDLPLEREIPRDFSDIKKFVKKRIQFHIKYSDSFEELTERLSKDDIHLDLKMKADGLAMLSFEHEGYRIKSSAMQLQYSKIMERLNENQKQTKDFMKSNPTLQKRLGNHYQAPYKPGQAKKVIGRLNSLTSIAERDAAEADFERKRKYNNGMGM
uniref:MS155, putative mobilization protein n=1 Tax=Microscilla sp. PRE1 TaxID=155537 RepID=Q93P76_9BACT|nr:relaxase/mobilization nuclease domain-containing protein [Microscilla sp. PRE1]AAK62877.1 MS155, putative mobilization protein [Microscilla sp. PRE1]